MAGASRLFEDLSAIRAGNQVSLAWSISPKAQKKYLARGFTTVLICRRDTENSPCLPVGDPLPITPGKPGSFSEMLPTSLQKGNPRVLIYSLQLFNPGTQSAGPPSTVATLVGAQPPYFYGLTAEVQPNGIMLRWPATPDPLAQKGMLIRIDRKSASPRSGLTVQDLLALPYTPDQDHTLEVDARQAQILDTKVLPGEIYVYRAQRLVRFTVRDQKLEIVGGPSKPVCIRTNPQPHPGNPGVISGEGSLTGTGCLTPQF